jgi:hypothetical protein
MNGEPKFPRVRFNPEVNLGHVLQILFLVGSVFGAYVSIQKDLSTQHAEFQVAMAGFESRLTVAEHAIIERRTEEQEFAIEMRNALEKIQAGLSDLRIQMVQRRGR